MSHTISQRQQRVQVERDRAEEQVKPVNLRTLRHGGADRRRPAGNRRDNADRGRCRVDDVGQLGAADLVFVRHRAHNRADRQAVKVIVHENQHAERGGCEQRAAAAGNPPAGPFAIGAGCAGLGDQRDQDAEQHKENEDIDVAANLLTHDAESGLDRRQRREPRVEQRPRKDTDQQRGINLFGNQRQRDCDNRREQRPNGCLHNE